MYTRRVLSCDNTLCSSPSVVIASVHRMRMTDVTVTHIHTHRSIDYTVTTSCPEDTVAVVGMSFGHTYRKKNK